MGPVGRRDVDRPALIARLDSSSTTASDLPNLASGTSSANGAAICLRPNGRGPPTDAEPARLTMLASLGAAARLVGSSLGG